MAFAAVLLTTLTALTLTRHTTSMMLCVTSVLAGPARAGALTLAGMDLLRAHGLATQQRCVCV